MGNVVFPGQLNRIFVRKTAGDNSHDSGVIALCGFVGIFEFKDPLESVRARALEMAKTVRHRGPDWSGIYANERAVLAHERLSIVDVAHGAPPLLDLAAGQPLSVNCDTNN